MYKCALNSDWRCVVGGDGKPGCVPTKANPRVPGAYAPYACIDNTHYAWGGILNSCATREAEMEGRERRDFSHG